MEVMAMAKEGAAAAALEETGRRLFVSVEDSNKNEIEAGQNGRPQTASDIWGRGMLSSSGAGAHIDHHAGFLRLAHSKLNARHVEPLCRAISAAKERADISAATDTNDADNTQTDRGGVTGLDLRDNILDGAAVARLVECLVEVGTVLHLDLSDNFKLGPAGAKAICPLLPPSFAPDGTPALRTLSLVNSGCGSVGAAALGAALELNTTLTRIEISDCRLGDAGAVAFGSALAENVCLEVCNLSGNGIGERGAQAVAAGLRYNNNLLKLDLSHNPRMGDKGVGHFGVALEENTMLASLDLSYTGAGRAAALVISEAFDNNVTMKTLLLSGNPLGEGGIRRLLRACTYNEHLEVMSLKGCNLFDVDTLAARTLERDRERAAAFAASKGGVMQVENQF